MMKVLMTKLLQELISCPADHQIVLDQDRTNNNFARLMLWGPGPSGPHSIWTTCVVCYDRKAALFMHTDRSQPIIYEYCNPAFPQNLLDDIINFYTTQAAGR